MAVPLGYNLRSLKARRFSTLSAALGIGLVVTVFILVLALAGGFKYTVRTTGSPRNVIALRRCGRPGRSRGAGCAGTRRPGRGARCS